MIAAITMVKDEQDIIRQTIGHLLNEGIDQVFVLDNMSTDDTPKILDWFVSEFPGRLHWWEDREVGYHQARKMNGVAALAHAHGADWILPVDADEFWYTPQGTLKGFIEGSDADVLLARTWSQVTSRLRHPDAKQFPKVAYRWHPQARLAQGAHSVQWPNARVAGGLEIREFQYRSLEQMTRKVRNGKAAYDATDLPESEGAHWRELGALSDTDIEHEWTEHVAAATVIDPVPWGDA